MSKDKGEKQEDKQEEKRIYVTERQEAFLQYLVVQRMSQRQAFKAAYRCKTKNDNSIDQMACRLLKNVKVQSRYKQLKDMIAAKIEEEAEVTVAEIVRELKRVGMTDTSKIVPVIHTVRDRIDPITKEPNGEIHGNQLILRATEELTEDERACIAGISENANGGITIKFNDKLKALELLMKYKGMLKDKVEVTGNINLGEYLDKVNGEEY